MILEDSNELNHAPLVSVIMNCYNSASYLHEAIDSVINQSYRNFEIVFWDNQSTDESAAIFKSYTDVRLKYYYAPEHKNLSSARNLAIKEARGKFLAFLDCDDMWTTNKLQSQMACFTHHEDVGIVYSPFKLLVNSTEESAHILNDFYAKFKYEAHQPINIYAKLLIANFIIFSTVVIRKSVFDKTGGFSENLVQNEDYEILLKSSLISLAVAGNEPLVIYRIHASNNSFQNNEKNFIENRIIYAKLPEDKNLKKAIVRNEIRYGLFKLIFQKKLSGIKLLFKPGAFSILNEIFYKKLKGN